MNHHLFRDRSDAGRQLAQKLAYLEHSQPLVLALPRGGVPVGIEVARALHAPLDLLLVRKIGVPGHSELAAGAIIDGARPRTVINEDVVRMAGVSNRNDATSMIASSPTSRACIPRRPAAAAT